MSAQVAGMIREMDRMSDKMLIRKLNVALNDEEVIRGIDAVMVTKDDLVYYLSDNKNAEFIIYAIYVNPRAQFHNKLLLEKIDIDYREVIDNGMKAECLPTYGGEESMNHTGCTFYAYVSCVL